MTTLSDFDQKIATLTEQAISTLGLGRTQFRDAMLRCGDICHEILLAHQDAGVSTFGIRKRLGQELSKTAGRTIDIYRMVRTSRAAALLGGGMDLGTISLEAIYPFSAFLQRLTIPRTDVRDRYGNKRKPAQGEAWEIIPKWAVAGKSLFAQAVTEGWGVVRIRSVITELTGKFAHHVGNPREATEEELPNMIRVSQASGTRDLADLLVQTILAHAAPEALLQAILNAPTMKKLLVLRGVG